MPEQRSNAGRARPHVQKSWIATLASLVVGLGLGMTFGRSLLDSAGIPESCVRTITRAERAIDAGTAVADDGRAALAAVRDLDIGEAGSLLADVKRNATILVNQAGRFDAARKRCEAERDDRSG